MTIHLTKNQIHVALPKVAEGLEKYVWLQKNLHKSSNPIFRRRFNHFYRIRRNNEWQNRFYELLESLKGKVVSFPCIFDALYQSTDRCEVSFAS